MLFVLIILQTVLSSSPENVTLEDQFGSLVGSWYSRICYLGTEIVGMPTYYFEAITTQSVWANVNVYDNSTCNVLNLTR